MNQTLLLKKKELVAEQETLKHERASVKLSGEIFDKAKNRRIHEIESELEEIADAEVLQKKRDDNEQSRAIRESNASRTEIDIDKIETILSGHYLEFARIQRASDQMRDALQSIFEGIGPLLEPARRVTGMSNIPELDEVNLRNRIWNRFAHTLGNFAPHGLPRVDAQAEGRWLPSWADQERQMLENTLARSIRRAQDRVDELRAPELTNNEI